LFFFHSHNNTGAQPIINEAFAESRGEQIYIDEWNTHPQKHSQPSWKDIRGKLSVEGRSVYRGPS
jgi:integrative and conjugative element protein (TIGR02256 family)